MGLVTWLGFGAAPTEATTGPAAGRGPAGAALAKPSQPTPPQRHQDAFRARRRAARWAAVARAMKWLVPAAALIGAAAVLWFSPVFAVRQGDISVTGLSGWIDRAEVSNVLAQDVGVPLIRLDPNQIEQRLMALSPVKQATVKRAWPTGLDVTLEPRQPAAAVPDEGAYLLLDAEANPVAQVDEVPEGLPVIAVPLTEGNRRTVESVLRVAASLPAWLSAQVASIGAETEDTVTLTLTGGIKVLWGDSSGGAVKAAAVDILMKQPDVASIDVTAPESPVVR
ncbi:MAG: FtsQ-type POTRA domain-containing protein [Bifidobacteriaceae bacterium]|jgi:cell division protein FtsQ|nr:FtsQ-type POTRA domain-containing protein [Bifidobacteriaceae bacterium]